MKNGIEAKEEFPGFDVGKFRQMIKNYVEARKEIEGKTKLDEWEARDNAIEHMNFELPVSIWGRMLGFCARALAASARSYPEVVEVKNDCLFGIFGDPELVALISKVLDESFREKVYLNFFRDLVLQVNWKMAAKFREQRSKKEYYDSYPEENRRKIDCFNIVDSEHGEMIARSVINRIKKVSPGTEIIVDQLVRGKVFIFDSGRQVRLEEYLFETLPKNGVIKVKDNTRESITFLKLCDGLTLR